MKQNTDLKHDYIELKKRGVIRYFYMLDILMLVAVYSEVLMFIK